MAAFDDQLAAIMRGSAGASRALDVLDEEEETAAVPAAPVPDTAPAPVEEEAVPEASAFDQELADIMAGGGEGESFPDNPMPQVEGVKDKSDPSTVDMIRHAVGGIPQAAFDVMDTPANVQQMVDEATGTQFRLPGHLGFGQELLARFIPSEQPGFAQAKEILAPDLVEAGHPADTAKTFFEWAAGGVYNALRRGVTKAIPDVIMGIGAAAGSLLDDEDQIAGELAGGITGGVVALGVALKTGDFSKLSGHQRKAMNWIQNNADNPEQAMITLRKALDDKEVGTLADLTKDQGIFDAEAALQKARPATAGRSIDNAVDARDQQIMDDIINVFGTGRNAEDGQKAATSYIDNLYDDMVASNTEKIDVATSVQQRSHQVVDDLQAAAGTDVKPSQASGDLKQVVTNKKDAVKKTYEDPAWDTFKDGPPVSVEGLAVDMKTWINDTAKLSKAEATALRRDYAKEFKLMDGWAEKGMVDPRELHFVISSMKNKSADAMATGAGNRTTNAQAGQLVKQMDNYLAANNSAYGEAKSITSQKYDKFGGDVGKASASEGERYANKLGFSGEQGAVTARNLKAMDDPIVTGDGASALPSPDGPPVSAVESAEVYMRGLAAREGVDAKFMKKYDEFLSEFPGLKDEFAMVAESRIAAKTADDGLKHVEKVAKDDALILKRKTTEDAIGMYSANPNTTITKFMSKTDNIPRLKELKVALDDIGAGESFRAQVRDELVAKVGRTTAGEAPKFTDKSLSEFSKISKALVDNGVMSAEEVNTISNSIARRGTNEMRKKAVAAMIGSPQGHELENLLASGLAVTSLKVLPAVGSPLILAGALRRGFKKMLTGKLKDGTVSAMEEFMVRPERFLDLADAKNAEDAAKIIIRRIVAAGQVAEVLEQEGEE